MRLRLTALGPTAAGIGREPSEIESDLSEIEWLLYGAQPILDRLTAISVSPKPISVAIDVSADGLKPTSQAWLKTLWRDWRKT